MLGNICIHCGNITNENLRKWFSDKWVNIGKKDKSGKHPACGTSGDKRAYAKCVPASKARSMSKKDKELVNKGQCDIRIIEDKKFYYTYRGKGVPTDKLNVEAFEKMKDGKIINRVGDIDSKSRDYTFSTQRDFQMKKNNVRLNKPQLEAKIDYFSITHLTGKETERILNKKPWNGREWKVSGSIPLR